MLALKFARHALETSAKALTGQALGRNYGLAINLGSKVMLPLRKTINPLMMDDSKLVKKSSLSAIQSMVSAKTNGTTIDETDWRFPRKE